MKRLVSCLALAAALVGCGAHTNPTRGSQTAPARPVVTIAEVPAGESHPSTAAADAAAPEAEEGYQAPPTARHEAPAGSSYEPQAAARPGLGTEWGETRASRVSTVRFERDDWSNPTAVATLYYDNADGVRAMTRGAALSTFASRGASVRGGGLTVRLLHESGSALPTFDFGTRTYVVGNHGDRYVIQIQNDTPQRFEVVATVDGLDVVDGEPGSFSKRGYLIGPWSTLEIDGFRRSLDEVAAFRFGSVASSYAARKGNARNVGVIGVAFFAERGARSPWLQEEAERRHRADPFPGRFAAPPP